MPRTDVLSQILARTSQELGPLVEKAKVAREAMSFGEIEAGVLAALWRIGAFVLAQLAGLTQGRRKNRVRGHKDVGTGRHWLAFKGMRWRGLVTVFGRIKFRRAYYHSDDPKDSRWPRDEQLGLTLGQIWSPGLQDRADYLATVTGSYQEAEKALAKVLAVEVPYKQIQRDCLRVGGDLAARQREESETALQVTEGREPAEQHGPECMMISTDGIIAASHDGGPGLEIKIGRIDRACLQKAAPEANRIEGNEPAMPTERRQALADLKESREQREYQAATGLVKEALAEVAPDRYERPVYRPSNPTSRYVATANKGTDIIGGLLWAAAVVMGVQTAELLLFLADGAHWCWNMCETHFPRAVQILDVFHLAKHLIETGAILWGERSQRAGDWARQALVAIFHGRLDAVLRELQALTFTDSRKRQARHELLTYLVNNRERMDYPRYLANGYPISSAAIEGACRHVIGSRMKGSGRRWDEAGADAMARLRALYCSGRWDAFYKERQRRIRQAHSEGRRAA